MEWERGTAISDRRRAGPGRPPAPAHPHPARRDPDGAGRGHRRRQAWKSIIPAEQNRPDLCTHEGYEWLYVLSGRLRLIVADHDLVMGPGEAAEFDTRLPHWFGPAGDSPVEVLNLFGRQGERMHVRARPRSREKAAT
ncbi:cupin domain-containing protein [Microtetraspora malaysiensis]|uniref:cupin domain-containing protein n=1 Tax=Microtetraspora malaysiensis TaxID=161358 RepID=UPI003D90AF42